MKTICCVSYHHSGFLATHTFWHMMFHGSFMTTYNQFYFIIRCHLINCEVFIW